MVSANLAEALQARRSDFNARFRLGAQRYPQLDGQELLRFVAESVDPLVVAVHTHHPGSVADVVSVAYDCALQIVGQRLSLGSGRYRVVPEVWRDVLPAAAKVVGADPARVIPALTNAAHQLASNESADATRWKQRMVLVASQVTSADELLLAGQVIAWQCGLAHYRDGALGALRSLPKHLACLILEIEPARYEATVQRFESDRWFDPSQPTGAALRMVRHTGSFRGLGGSFLQPPLLKGAAGGWMVQSAGDYWFLVADAFGATSHRATAEEWTAQPEARAQHVGTRLVHDGKTLDMPGAGLITSSALSVDAIACTFAHSHHIALVALN